MPQSLSAMYFHLVFSTKERRASLQDGALREAMHAYLGGIAKRLDCAPLRIGGVADHVHVLGRLGRNITQANLVKELKRVSSLWIKEQGPSMPAFSGRAAMRSSP